MRIWHICDLDYDLCNGMVAVIPEHVRNQAQFADVLLLNLSDYKPDLGENVPSLFFGDYNEDIRLVIDKYQRPDLVVIHGVYSPKIWKFWTKNIKGKIIYVIVSHGSLTRMTQKRNGWKKVIANMLVVNRFIKLAGGIHLLTEGEKKESAAMLKTYSFVLPNGVYIEPYNKSKSKYNGIKIVFIGRYNIYHKGLDLLLDACEKIKQYIEKNSIRIEMYGDLKKNDSELFISMVKEKGLDSIVMVNDAVYGTEKREKYLNSDYFILPSRSEGLPMGYLEACSLGVPVLITEATNMADDVRTFLNGCVAETSVGGVIELLRFAVENYADYEKMSVASYECAKKYEWASVARNVLEEYRKFIS